MIMESGDVIIDVGVRIGRRSEDESQILFILSLSISITPLLAEYIFMRVPSFPSIVRTFYTIANATAIFRSQQPYRALGPLNKPFALRSMPSIPFFGSLFSSTPASSRMTYADNRSDQEWQAVLNKGPFNLLPRHTPPPFSSSRH